MGLIYEKNRGRKSRDTAPLRWGGDVVPVPLGHIQGPPFFYIFSLVSQIF